MTALNNSRVTVLQLKIHRWSRKFQPAELWVPRQDAVMAMLRVSWNHTADKNPISIHVVNRPRAVQAPVRIQLDLTNRR